MILQNFDSRAFINSYWQKKPLLIKHAGPAFIDPISADELAGLACEEAIESRLVTTTPKGEFQLRNGPFEDSFFAQLGGSNWTLLVQAVDQYIAEVEALKSHFNFLPSWRIDDVMVSYACDGGGVGPHYDQYDVFLVQGSGSRRWRLGPVCDDGTQLQEESELRLIKNFVTETEFTLEAGDILYLPPRVAHHGVSLGESLCYSVGFRAPSVIDIIQGYTDMLTFDLSEDDRYVDPVGASFASPCELTQDVISSGYKKLMHHITNETAFIEWFGCYVSTPKYRDFVVEPETLLTISKVNEYINNNKQSIVISKNSSSRFTYYLTREQLKLFVDGHCFHCGVDKLAPIRKLCESPWMTPLPITFLGVESDSIEILLSLLNQGSLYISA